MYYNSKCSVLDNPAQFYQIKKVKDRTIIIERSGYADDNYFYFMTRSNGHWIWCAVQHETGRIVHMSNSIVELIDALYIGGIDDNLNINKYSDQYVADCELYDHLIHHQLIMENFS